MADYTFADLIPGFTEREAAGWHEVAGVHIQPLLNPAGHVSMVHVFWGTVGVFLILGLAAIARQKYRDRESALIPEGRFSIRNFFEGLFDAVYSMMEGMLGERLTRRYFPLLGALAIYIYVSNLMGLFPGLSPATSNLNTTIGPALIVFVVYNFAGIQENGIVAHIKHMMGPVLLLAPLIFLIEVVSHIARPLSLAVRLGGNMTGDHMVLGVFGDVGTQMFGVPLLAPIPIYFLGLMVCTIQTLVFCLLSTVYLALATAHDDDH